MLSLPKSKISLANAKSRLKQTRKSIQTLQKSQRAKSKKRKMQNIVQKLQARGGIANLLLQGAKNVKIYSFRFGYSDPSRCGLCRIQDKTTPR
ncbi:hypothetical protein CQA40_10455 [Helicobacter sp. MIT 01-3238]|nr:hypothetical protein CQA40_10455 [Helicobacter sp. MIT 01-3238]